MARNKWVSAGLLFLLTVALVLGGIIFHFQNSKGLKVIFLDVGQGDAILVQQGSNQLLIDGGKSGKVLLEKLGSYVPFWDRQIEVIVATHPDQDHIGGLIDVFRNYEISGIIKTKAGSESQTYKSFVDEIEKENSEVVEARKGVGLKFPNGAVAEIIFPVSSLGAGVSADSNADSVVLGLNYGENNFLFTGDLPDTQEGNLNVADIDFLKVSHHGSRYSTSADFLEKVNAQEAIISVGKNNRYGHPNPDVLSRLSKSGVKTWRTDEMGDIIYKCDEQSGPPTMSGGSEGGSVECKLEFQ